MLDDLPLLYQLNGGVADRRGEAVPAEGYVPLRRRAGGGGGRGAAAAGRESCRRRGGLLLAEGRAAGRCDAGVPGRAGKLVNTFSSKARSRRRQRRPAADDEEGSAAAPPGARAGAGRA